MNYTLDEPTNFCRVFELPREYPTEFCFQGGHLTPFMLVDWFNPVPLPCTSITHEELVDTLVPYVKAKSYVRSGSEYLILCDFGAALTFKGETL